MFYLLYKIFSNFSFQERRLFIIASVVFIISGIFVAINFYYATTEEVAAAGGTYTEGMIGQPIFINPLIASGSDIDHSLMELVFSDLGDLLEKPPVMAPDKKSWTIILKKGVLWDDGKPLTANDVIFTIETIQNPNTHSPLASTWQGVIAEKINDDEVRITLKTPYAFFTSNLTSLKITPQHIFGAIPPSNLRLSEYNLEPISSGPYSFSHMNAEKDGFITEMIFTPNKNFIGTNPFIQKIVIRFYRNEQLIIDDFNIRTIQGLGGINPDLVPNLKIEHRLLTFSVPRYYAVFLNASGHPALRERNVRHSLIAATNIKKIISEVFHEYATTIHGPLPPGVEGYNPTLYSTSTKAISEVEKLLEDNEWLLNPEDGIRYKTIEKNRVKLAFEIVTPDIPFLVKTVLQLRESWKPLGISLTPLIVSVDNVNKGALKTRNYQMIIFGNILKNNPDIFSFWHSSQKFYPGLNLALYDNKAVDNLLEKIREEQDSVLRQTYLDNLQTTIVEDAPVIFLYNPTYLYAVTSNLRGLTAKPIATAAERFNNIHEWHLKTKRVFANNK